MEPITYVKQNWKNKEEEEAIPLNDKDLNHIENGIFTVTERANAIDTSLKTLEGSITQTPLVEDSYTVWQDETITLTDSQTYSITDIVIPRAFDDYWTHVYLACYPTGSNGSYKNYYTEIIAPIRYTNSIDTRSETATNRVDARPVQIDSGGNSTLGNLSVYNLCLNLNFSQRKYLLPDGTQSVSESQYFSLRNTLGTYKTSSAIPTTPSTDTPEFKEWFSVNQPLYLANLAKFFEYAMTLKLVRLSTDQAQ